MRRQSPRDVGLRESRSRTQDKLSASDGGADVRGDQGQLDIMPAVDVLDDDAGARSAMRLDHVRVAAPQSYIMALQCQIAGSRERAIAAAEYRDFHAVSPRAVASMSFSMKCWTFPRAVRGRSTTKTISRGTLNRASCA